MEELIKNLKKTFFLLEANEKIVKELENYNQPAIPMGLSFIIFLGVLSFIFYGSILNKEFGTFINPYLTFENMIFGIGALFIIILFSLHFINKFCKKRRLAAKKARIEEITFQFNDNLKWVEENSEAPKAYRYTLALRWIIFYLENLRADNLKEAINLFEEEQRQNKMLALQAQTAASTKATAFNVALGNLTRRR